MSYCVNCGVELAAAEKQCPLCGVEVINPQQPPAEDAELPYASRMDPVLEKINRRFVAGIISIILAFPAFFTLVIDLSFHQQVSWSLYSAGGLAVIGFILIPYLLYSRPTFLKLFIPPALAILIYLGLIAWIQSGIDWFFHLALPLYILAGLLILLQGILISRRLVRHFYIPAMVLTAVGLLNLGIEIIINRYRLQIWQVRWSLYVLIPFLSLALVFLLIARRQAIRSEISRRLHV